MCSRHWQQKKAGGLSDYDLLPYRPKEKPYIHKGRPPAKGWLTQQGYRKILVGGRRGRVISEHRLVMEKVLGRELLPTEHIHHMDGDKLNNDPSNLQIVSKSEHTRHHNYLRGQQ